MNRTLLVALLSFTPLPALAQNLTVGIDGVNETWTLSPHDKTRFEDWVKMAYPCLVVAPATTCDPITMEQSEALWAQATLQGTLDNVVRHHKVEAATGAANGVAPMTPVSKASTPNAKSKK